ncbi:uncharacterized protein LOC122856185 [Aphidius gifuensis]|uniref:uncharacterized protein LOC122856185 n=1 Tax=Aphidius gifuensis TaxID=684658 RepID=UPI001CDD2B05|nr:uncharacterized protein LOC122856185 [Aphidius gifuensis]
MEPSYRVETFTMPVNKLNDNEMDDVKFANKLKTNDDNIEKKISVISLIKDFESIVNKNEEISLPVFGEVKSSPSKKFVKKKETIVTVAPVTSSVPVNVVEENDVYKIEDKKDDQVKEINIKQSEKCEAEKINDNVLEHDENNTVEIQEDKYNEQSVDTVDAINEPIYDVPIPWHLRRPIFTNETLKKSEFINENSEKLIRTSSLMSIDELGESLIDDDNDDDNNDDNCNEFCCHGLKNGCTVIRQKPEQITEDIFKTNWLKRIEELRERETAINNKELILAEIHDKYYHEKMVKKDNAKSLISLGSEKSLDLKNPPNSKSSLITTATAPAASVASVASAAPSTTTTISSSSPKKKLPIAELNVPLKNQQSVYHSQTSFRKKRKQKICYDDLDSTLSADIGDSSFIVTSTKFNPEIFKKPMAFTRSSSERRPKNFLERPLSNIFEDDKVLKRISDNILVSQDESTIFQDYGLIDNHNKKNDNKSTAYLDLDNGSLNKINNKNQKINKKQQCNNKTTTLWNEKSDEWLQKKRQAYNSANQKIPIEDFDTTPINNNKENHSNDFKNDICQKIKTLN